MLGIGGLIALSATLFNGCVQCITFISAARHMEGDANRIACALEYEEYRLMQWGDRVGIYPGGIRNQLLNWGIIKDILEQLHELLTDSKTLKEQYNLEYVSDIKSGSTSMAMKAGPGRKGIGRLWSHASPKLKRSRAEIIQTQAGPLKRLRWVTIDQDKIRRLIDDISKFSNYLYSLLGQSDQDFLRKAVAALLRDLISRSGESSDVEIIKLLLDIDKDTVSDSDAIDAAATVKQTRLLLGVDQRADETSNRASAQINNHVSTFQGQARPRPVLSRLQYQYMVRNTTDIGKGREIAIYRNPSSNKKRNARILVEWKPVDKRADAKLERRIQELSLLLCNLADDSFHSLKCLGYLKHKLDDAFHNYAYIYELVDMTADGESEILPQVWNLSQLLKAPRKPSLTQRIHMCKVLAETILQLHTAGWLHKNICADNVLFVDRESHSWNDGTSLGPYLSGYEFTRNSLEETEKMPADSLLDLYRHPEAQPDSGRSFLKAFDLYALGCTLLVIILWERLNKVFRRAYEDFAKDISLPVNASESQKAHRDWTKLLTGKGYLSDQTKIKGILDRVAFSAGDSVSKVVEKCFFPTQDKLEDDEEDEDVLEISVNVQISILELLESLKDI